MNEKEFCKLYSEFYGEEISNIKQIMEHRFAGEELFEFCNFILKNTSSGNSSKIILATDDYIIDYSKSLYKSGNKIDAVKYLMRTGMGLKESYDYIQEHFKNERK